MPASSNWAMADPLSRRQFLARSALGAVALGAGGRGTAGAQSADGAARPGPRPHPSADRVGPARHPIERDRPAGNFLDGAILGNGALGAVVTPLPDAVMIYCGHNAVWDQRMAPLDLAQLGTFAETLKRVEAVPATAKALTDDPWFNHYQALAKASYLKVYPRPLGCGAVALRFDRRRAEVIGYRLEIDRGLCRVAFLTDGRRYQLELFADLQAERVWGRMVDEEGRPAPAPFLHLAIIPDTALPAEFPHYTHHLAGPEGAIAYRQVLPYAELSAAADYRPHPKDRAFWLGARVNCPLDLGATLPHGIRIGAKLGSVADDPGVPFGFVIELVEGLATAVPPAAAPLPEPGAFDAALRRSGLVWAEYWARSSVALADELLERTWYWNMYFLRCALRADTVAPGIYAICPVPNQPVVWHGDYHLDYNTEQAFWSTFSSNHPELNLPYVALVENMLPAARDWAQRYYGMRGAYFPISSYPVEMRSYPYAAPVFNWMVGVTPWVVQGIWWHYLYTQDPAFLRDRAFGPIQAVAQFLIDFIRRGTGGGAGEPAHVYPSFPPELYALQPGLPKAFNSDTLVDLTLIRFVFRAYQTACRVLDRTVPEAADLRAVEEILEQLPPYPTAMSTRGRVYVSVSGEDPEKVYNVPVSLMSVFPGEDQGLHSPPEELAIASATYRNQQNEGGNDLVFLNLQGARLGLLDLEKFKREIRYTLGPNGTCADLNLQIGGRFGPGPRQYNWMLTYGIWFENFALPVVINECLMQGYRGELRVFPNWPLAQSAEFRSLRMAGAFLISGQCHSGQVQWIEALAERGGSLTVISPWPGGARVEQAGETRTVIAAKFVIHLNAAERVRLIPA
jgi:alpha-L-fucosidase 2